MLMKQIDKKNPNHSSESQRQKLIVKIFRKTPWQELLPYLYEHCFYNKLDDEEVSGGSALYKFMNK